MVGLTNSLRVMNHRALFIFNRLLQHCGNPGFFQTKGVGTSTSSGGGIGPGGGIVAGTDGDFAPSPSIFVDPHLKTSDLLQLMSNFQWCGYYGENNFYRRCTNWFLGRIVTVTAEELVTLCEVYGKLEGYHGAAFRARPRWQNYSRVSWTVAFFVLLGDGVVPGGASAAQRMRALFRRDTGAIGLP